MHVGFSLLSLAPGELGGSEVAAFGLLRAFAAGKGPDAVTVIGTREVEALCAELPPAAVRFRTVPYYHPGRTGLNRAARLAAALAAPARASTRVADGLDVIHYPLTIPVPRTRLPAVVTIHDLQHHELPHLFRRSELAFRRYAYDRTAKRAERVVVLTEHTKAMVVERLDLAAARIDVIPHGIDHRRFHPDPGNGGPEAGLPERFLLYPANMWPHKNHERLFQAFQQRAERELKLVLTGARTPSKGTLPPDVIHLGRVAPDRLPSLYRDATALMYPSLFEGFGLPVLEAMACDCPVAASSTGAVAEVAGGAALLFEPRDVSAITAAIDRIAGDVGLREHLRAAGRSRAREFTWERASADYAAAYARALGR